MPRIVRCGLIQASNVLSPDKASLADVREAMIAKHVRLIEEAAGRGVQILCLQELFYGPYFAAEQDPRWYEFTEKVPDGPTIRLMQEIAKKHAMVMVVPVYEEEATASTTTPPRCSTPTEATWASTARTTFPIACPRSGRSSTSSPATSAIPVFKTHYATIGVYICYDRHFPEGARLLGLHGAEIVFKPSATMAGHSRIPLEDRAAGAGRRERLLRGRHQPGRHAKRPGTSASSTAAATSAIPRGRSWPSGAGTRTSWWSRTSTST